MMPIVYVCESHSPNSLPPLLSPLGVHVFVLHEMYSCREILGINAESMPDNYPYQGMRRLVYLYSHAY